ncbi:DUF6273 domain-containing protein [Enterococcus sp. UD-01]|jgi:hypothetical protein|uniref:DUF6273 domain-containing protein n=1 Tax=Enterococcus sp. UD-01 TaxID=3373911 RepID=UPI0038397405
MKRSKGLKATIINLLKVLGGLLVVWGIWGVIQLNKPLTIKDIAYDNLLSVVNKFEGYTVYLKENGEYEPYLVLSKNYNGDGEVVLLRKYLLDEPRIYNENERFAAYYENSKIDQYLNSKFLSIFDETILKQLTTSKIQITDESSVGSVGKITTTIPRKIFLLSRTEIAAGKSRIAAEEGKKLLYFMGFHSYIATTKAGEAEPYWLRTPYTEHDTTVWAIRNDGSATYTTLEDMTVQKLFKLSVRPAFCVAKDTKLERKEGIVKGKKVFVLKEEKGKGENKK